MFAGHIKDSADRKVYPEAIQKAINYLKENDLTMVEAGKYPLDGDAMILQVMDTNTKDRTVARPEIHHKYIDVQFLVKGAEEIGYYPDLGDNEIDEDLLDTKDMIYYKNNPNAKETRIVMSEGAYAVFFPWDVHIPALVIGEPAPVRRVVVKVQLDTVL